MLLPPSSLTILYESLLMKLVYQKDQWLGRRHR
jgi:hypothetical protein